MSPRFRLTPFFPAFGVAFLAGATLVGATLASPTLASAQDAQGDTLGPPACNPNMIPTPRLALATVALQRAFYALAPGQDSAPPPPAEEKKSGWGRKKAAVDTTPIDPVTELKKAITIMTEPLEKKQEPVDSLGINYYLGQAYMVLLEQPGINPIGRRGDFGIATDTSLTIDLLAAADTLLTKVSETMPGCRAEVARWRQQKPWVTVLNGSIAALNAEQYDSAEYLAKRSLIIERDAPYAYSVLAMIANRRKDYATATEYLNKVLEIVETDTIYAEEGIKANYELANTATLRAQAAADPEKQELVREAIKAWHEYLPMGGRDYQVANSLQIMIRLLRSIGDTATMDQVYAPIKENPAHYGEATLLNAGLIATQAAKKPQDAVTFFAAVVEKNPYQRDGLNNLAASYAATGKHEKMFPLINRLVDIDPNNHENWLLYAYAYSGLLKENKDPAKKKVYEDSLMYYNDKSEKLTPRLALTSYTHNEVETALSGSLEHYVPQTKSVSGKTMSSGKKSPPKTYTVTVDFLNEKGEVLGTVTESVGPITQGATEPFTISLKEQDAPAFRYTITEQ